MTLGLSLPCPSRHRASLRTGAPLGRSSRARRRAVARRRIVLGVSPRHDGRRNQVLPCAAWPPTTSATGCSRTTWGGDPVHRDVAVCATPEELQAFGRDGFLIREAAIGGDWLQSLTEALDRLTRAEWPAHRPPLDANGTASMAAEEMPARSWGRNSAPPARQGRRVPRPARLAAGVVRRARHDGAAGAPSGFVRPGLLCRCGTAGHALAPTPARHPEPPAALVFATTRHRLPDLSRRLERRHRRPLGGAGLAPLARPRATAAALRTHPGRANASPAGRQHGDHPRQPVATGASPRGWASDACSCCRTHRVGCANPRTAARRPPTVSPATCLPMAMGKHASCAWAGGALVDHSIDTPYRCEDNHYGEARAGWGDWTVSNRHSGSFGSYIKLVALTAS